MSMYNTPARPKLSDPTPTIPTTSTAARRENPRPPASTVSPRATTQTVVKADAGDRQCPATCDCIRARAFEIFEARRVAGQPGDAESDWLRAEAESNKGLAPIRAGNPAPPASDRRPAETPADPLVVETVRPTDRVLAGGPHRR